VASHAGDVDFSAGFISVSLLEGGVQNQVVLPGFTFIAFVNFSGPGPFLNESGFNPLNSSF
jgi:hypothetical protein